MKELAYLNKYLYKYKYRLILGTIFVIISNLFAIIPAQIVRKALDYIQKTSTENNLKHIDLLDFAILKFGLLILAMALLKGLFLFFMRQTIIVMSRLIEFDLKNEIYQHYQTLPLSFYRQNNTGDLMARISEDVGKVRMYLGPAIMYGLNLFFLAILVVYSMLSVNSKLTLIVLCPLPFLSILIYIVSNTIEKKSTQIQKSLSNLSSFTQEAFSGIRVLKAFVRENDSKLKMEAEAENYRSKQLALTKVQAFFQPLVLAMIGLSTILTVYIGGIEVNKGNITIGVIAEFIMYVFMLTWPVTSLGWTTSLVQRASASQKRINEFLNIKSEIVSKENSTATIQGQINFNNVSLTYSDSSIKAIKNISFSIESQKSLGILGTTGSGKSTIANLITRMYDVDQGEILIDGKNIKSFSPNHLRSNIGYVPQDVFLFSDTIKNNIAFGKKEINNEEIETAAKKADLYENVMAFPEQFETIVGERGITLSGGQKQRVSIARALIIDPKILILDDCLSAVDTKTENTILQSINSAMKQRTTVIISHRVSSVKLADKIIVLDKGEIVEEGSHDELIALNSVYKSIFSKQLEQES
jgi:ATP-binding cassette subfamily B protein